MARKPRPDALAGQNVLPGLALTPAATLKDPTLAENRILDAAVEIYGAEPSELRYLHVVLAQCGLPYREPEAG